MQSAAALLLLAGAGLNGPAQAADWPHWRGPQRNGVVTEDSGWKAGVWSRLRPRWTIAVGEGASSPVVSGGVLFAIGWSEGRERLSAWKVTTGERLWEQSYPAPRYGRKATGDEGLYSGTTSTPEYDPATGLLFTLGSDGDLRCWDIRGQGRPVWARNLYETYDVPRRPRVGRSGLRDYGYTTSPLVQGDVLIVEVGATTGTLIGFDTRTGEELWRSEVCSPAGHTGGPVPLTVDGVLCVAVHHFDGLLVARIDAGHAGKTVCEIPWRTEFANNIATPAVFENNVILTSSYDQHRIARYRISLQEGARQLWERKEASKVCSPVVHAGSLYWAWREVHCLDLETGRTRWQGGPLGDPGSLVLTGDDRLILWTNRGDLRLIESAVRSPDAFRQLAEVKNIGRQDAWPHVVLADGQLICKDRSGQIVCLPLALSE